MNALLFVFGGMILLLLPVAVIGSRLQPWHQVARSVSLRAPRAEVYRVITDFGGAPRWRRGVKRVEFLEPLDGRPRFREHGKHGAITFEATQIVPPQLLVTRIADTGLGYSGSWIYSLAAEGSGTRLTITEFGEVSNIIFRFLSRFVLGHTATIDAYLSDLSSHLADGP
jgi:uncharacterized protein YndB with AHSA1/START domain